VAAKKDKPAEVVHAIDSDGGHHIGVVVDGVYVSLASASAEAVADRVAAGKSPEYADHPLAGANEGKDEPEEDEG
jgi:hypothetical protein